MPRISTPNATARAAAHAEQRRKMLELRKAGASYQQIADQLGLRSRSSVYEGIQRELKAIPREAARELVDLELQRLDSMFLALWSDAKKGKVHSIDRCIRIMERRAAMLGIDAKFGFDSVVVAPLGSDAREALLERLSGLVASAAGAGGEGADPPKPDG